MERIATELAIRLAEALESFTRSSERLLHVRCDAHSAKLAETVVTAVTSRAPSIAIVLRSPVSGAAHEWGARAIELACWYAGGERERLARGEPSRGALPRGLLARPDATSFAAVLGAVLARTPGEAPAYVVLAPLAASRALDALTLATTARALPARARVICLEREPPSSELQGMRGVRALDLRLDQVRLRQEIAERFEAMAAAPEDATGLRATGAAGPRVAPPPRPCALAPSIEARETRRRAAGVRRVIAAFAAATTRGDAPAILATQRAASDALSSMGAHALAAQLRVARAGALAATGRLEDGLRECADVRRSGDAAGDHAAVLAALSCAAGLLIAGGHLARARSLCDELASAAEAAGNSMFAAHALRSCAQLAARCGDPAGAAASLDRALAIGERAEPHVIVAGPFTTVVSELVALCRAHGLEARADEAERRGHALTARAYDALSAAGEDAP